MATVDEIGPSEEAHTLWSLAQLAPGEGVVDAARRIDAYLTTLLHNVEIPEPTEAEWEQMHSIYCLDEARGDARACFEWVLKNVTFPKRPQPPQQPQDEND